MTPKQPPAIPTWMLKHFGSGPNNDVLLGDLAEQYRQNDDVMWYWRQAMKAIPVSFFKELRGHKATAARALLMGWGLWTFYVVWIIPFVTPYFWGTGTHNIGVAIVPSDPIGTTWTVLSAPVGFHLALERPFSFLFAVPLSLFVWALCGWLVARFHRGQQTCVVLLFAVSILLMNLLLNVPLLHYVPFISLGLLAANAATSFLGVLLGGGLFRSKPGLARG